MRSYRSLRKKKRSRQRSFGFAFQFVILWLIVLLGVNFFLFFNKKGVEYRQKKEEIVKLQDQIIKLQQEKASMFKKAFFLNTKEGIEKIAREKIGLVKPNELAFVIVSPFCKTDDNKEVTNLQKIIKKQNWFDRFLKNLKFKMNMTKKKQEAENE